MAILAGILPYLQVTLSVLIIGAVLLQQRGSSVGGAFGDNSDTTFYTRRGAEKWLFQATIVLGVLFALASLSALFVR